MLSVPNSPSPIRLIALALLLICLLGSISGCINNSTTNPPDAPDTSDTDDGGDSDTDPGDDTPPPTSSAADTGLKMLANGGGHTCAVKNRDGSLWCWGLNSSGQLGDLSVNDASSFKAISSEEWLTIATGGEHTCGIKADNTIWCWGLNDSGQLGSGSNARSSEEIDITPDTNWLLVATGTNHTCAIRDDNTLWCWGDNTRSQLGDGSVPNPSDENYPDDKNLNIPKQIGTQTDWIAISLGDEFSCGIRAISDTDKRIYCWGDNSDGQLGQDPASNPLAAPQDATAMTDWASISTGHDHSCAIKQDQTLHCWGDNIYGQLGQGNTADSFTPVQVASGSLWTDVATGNGHTCGIKDDATLWCWGNNATGQLGVGNTSHQAIPTQISHENDWLSVFAGNGTTCAIDSDHIGFCWGLNEKGQLGNGVSTETGGPRMFDTSDNWNSLDSGGEHTCGLKDDSGLMTLWCGGGNSFGQLGIGSTTNQAVTVQIKGSDGLHDYWDSFSTGHYHSCAIDNSQALYCWGNNSHGQLGKGTVDGNVPANWTLAKVTAGADDWSIVGAGASHTCGIKNSTELWCWGDNATGQIGDGGSGAGLRVSSPTQITSDMWLDVAVGGFIDSTHTEGGHTCGIKIAALNDTEGTLWCWGENDFSQLGNEATTNEASPTQIGFETDWASIDAGNQHTCAKKTDDTLYCWGRHTLGQTGVGASNTTFTQSLPGQISGTWGDYDLGYNSNCGVNASNALFCWGDNSTKQITSNVDDEIPNNQGYLAVPGDASFTQDWQAVAMGKTHGCGIREDNLGNRTAHCWGEGAQYQLGDGNAWKETPLRLSLE